MKKYKNSKIPPILVLGDEKEEELKLFASFSKNITEYYSDQEIDLLFPRKILYPYKIRNLFIYNNRSQHFNVPLFCNYGPGSKYNFCKCKGDFSKLNAGMYTNEKLEYDYLNYKNIYPSRNIIIKVHQQPMYELKLLSVRGDAFQGNTTLNLKFNGDVILNAFTGFYLFNRSKIFEVTHGMINQYDRSSITVNLNLKKVPIGTYNVGLFYRGFDWRYHDKYITVEKNRYPDFTNIGY